MPERATASSRSEKSAEAVVVGGEAGRLNGGEGADEANASSCFFII